MEEGEGCGNEFALIWSGVKFELPHCVGFPRNPHDFLGNRRFLFRRTVKNRTNGRAFPTARDAYIHYPYGPSRPSSSTENTSRRECLLNADSQNRQPPGFALSVL